MTIKEKILIYTFSVLLSVPLLENDCRTGSSLKKDPQKMKVGSIHRFTLIHCMLYNTLLMFHAWHLFSKVLSLFV